MTRPARLAALALLGALLPAAALADGYEDRAPVQGPAPLRAEPAPKPVYQPAPAPSPVAQSYIRAPQPVYSTACCVRAAPVVTRRVVRTAPAPAPRVTTVTLDSSVFTGGVGAGVDGGYYGGGGGSFVSTGTRAYSGVTASAAARFTFNYRGGYKGGGGKHHGGGCGGCGGKGH